MAQRTGLADSHVLITGSGIGHLLALAAAKRGAREVVIWDLNSEVAEAVAKELVAMGVKATAHSVDVSDRTAVARAAREVADKLGHIDVLVNNAGIVSGKSFLDLTEAEIRKTYDVNTFALY
jgi:all-trans-retinol dehydrogenase (NAD+)